MPEDAEADAAGMASQLAPIYDDLRRFAAVVGSAEIEPDDLVQEAVVRLLVSGQLTTVRDVKAYLRTAIVNVASNERRRLGRQRAAFTRLRVSTAADVTYPSDLSYLASLSATSRALLYLVDVEGASVADAAATVDCSVVAARARLSRARRELRADLSLGEANG